MLSKEKLKELAKLKTKKGRNEQGRFLIEGLRLCEEAADSFWSIESVLFTSTFEEKSEGKELLKKLANSSAELVSVKNQILAKLSDTVTAQGIICVAKRKKCPVEDIWKKNLKLILALDGIRDPGNVGTLIRTADAFGVDGGILSDDTVELCNPKVLRSTMGSIFHLPIYDEVDLKRIIPELKKNKFRIFGTHAHQGKPLNEIDPSGKICLLIGNEAKGLDGDLLQLSDQIVHIPTYGKAESLNVAVAGGILLYGIAKKRKLTCTR